MFGGNTANIKAVITAEDHASKELSKFGSHASNIAKKTALGFTIAAGAAIAFGVKAVKAYEESENAAAQLNAVLKSTHGVAGVTADAANHLASSLQNVTKFSDEDVLSAENLLLTFTSIGKKIFPQATETVLDMATALGEDTKSASIQLGKALQDPILGITALRRVGVNFNDEQKKVIQNLVDTGQKAKAQQLILKELKTEFGGSARAAGETFAGKLEILKNHLNDAEEAIGGVIINALTPFAKQLSDFVASDKFQAWLKEATKWIQTNLPLAINYLTTNVFPVLKQAFDILWPVIKTVTKVLAELVKFMADHKWIVDALVGSFVALRTAMFLTGAVRGFTAAMVLIRGQIALTSGSVTGLYGLITKGAVMGNIAVAGALADIALVYKAVMTVRGAINAMNNAKQAMSNKDASDQAVLDHLRNTIRTGTPNQAARARMTLHTYASTGHFAGGTDYAPGGMAVVGEKGPELVNLPRGAQVIPNNKLPQAGNNITININAGAFMGSQIEARKYAKMIMDAYSDLAASKNMTTKAMMGV